MVARTVALVLAGGSGTRTGLAVNKVLVPIAGRSALRRSLATMAAVDAVDDVVVVARASDHQSIADQCAGAPARAIVAGGATRTASERAGLEAVASAIEAGEVDLVLVHDAARPFASPGLVADVVATARRRGGALPGLPLGPGTVRRTADGVAAVDGRGLRRVQTPQAFRAAPLLAAHRAAAAAGFDGADTAACVARFAPDLTVVVIPGEPDNIKVTVAADFARADALARHLDRR